MFNHTDQYCILSCHMRKITKSEILKEPEHTIEHFLAKVFSNEYQYSKNDKIRYMKT